jgi:excisionase family DNA binding protein
VHEDTLGSAVGQTLAPLLSINECARFLGVARSTIYALVQREELHPVRVGQRLRFRISDLEAYLERGASP